MFWLRNKKKKIQLRAPAGPVGNAQKLFMLLLMSADIFSKFTFSKNSPRNTIRVSMVWIQIRSDGLSALVWDQTVKFINR